MPKNELNLLRPYNYAQLQMDVLCANDKRTEQEKQKLVWQKTTVLTNAIASSTTATATATTATKISNNRNVAASSSNNNNNNKQTKSRFDFAFDRRRSNV